MRAVLGGETVLDTRRAKLLHASGAFPTHWFPLDDVRGDLLVPAGRSVNAEPAERFDVRVGDRLAAGAVQIVSADSPRDPPLTGYATVDFGAMDRWFEEDEPIYAHPRDPYHRVDVRASSQRVVVSHNSVVVAESLRPKLLFETGNPIRYYLPFDDVHLEFLVRSGTVSECPYKGDGQHWHVHLSGGRIDDAAWSLPHPLPEGYAAAEHVCFYPSKVDVRVDGQLLVEPT
jgi:uncharacterized protein (DUF427 family)